MKPCLHTAALTERLLADDRARGQLSEDHAETCANCAEAVARVAVFDAVLRDVTRSLVAAPVQRIEFGGDAMPGQRPVARLGLLAIAATSAAVIVGLLLVGPLVSPQPSQDQATVPGGTSHSVPDRLTAAAFLGVLPESILLTEDGALAVRTEPTRLSLVLIRIADDEVHTMTLSTIDSGREIVNQPGFAVGTAVACPDKIGLSRTRYLYGFSHHGPYLLKPKLEGLPALGSKASDGTYLFAIDAGGFDARTRWKVTLPGRTEEATEQFFRDLLETGTLTPAGCRQH